MLRHRGVFGDMEAVDRSTDELVVLRKYPDPVMAEFRRGGDFSAVVSVVRANRYVEVRAAVGAGKSTEIPLRLSNALGCLVIHVIPFHIAAQYLADYLMNREKDGDKFVYMDDLSSDMPAHGVVLMSAPFFHARHAYDKFLGVSNAVLYLDESHESDGWTASLRTIAPAIKSFRVVKATATSAPGTKLTPDLPSARVELTYQKKDPALWSAHDKGVPWAATAIQANTMMCIDREATRLRLAAQYADHGITVRDCSNEDYAYFSETMSMLKDDTEGVIVVFVDYKFRSSFTVPGVSVFIDSCDVGVPRVVDDAPKMSYRSAYDFEVQQFLGRGGRMPGTPVKLYRSSEPSLKMMCDLESLECDAANLLYRMMGFRPPLDYAEYPYFRGKVPMDIAEAFASVHPLRLYPDTSRVPWVNGHKALAQEKLKAAYAYEMTASRKAKAVSCYTVPDADRSRTPPPSVPDRYRSLTVDVDGLDDYRSSRDSSPSVIFTVDTDHSDNLSAIRELAAQKPRRVAKRVLDERALRAAALEQEKVQQEQTLVGNPVQVVTNAVDSRPSGFAGGSSANDSGALARQQTIVARVATQFGDQQGIPNRQQTVVAKTSSKSAELSSFAVAAESIRPMYTALRDSEDGRFDLVAGKYYHYHNMENAPDFTAAFIRGVDSVVSYCDNRDARRYVKGLSEPDKLFAMRALVDACNHSTAVATGMQRLFAEVSKRPPDQWLSILDRDAMTTEVEWMIARTCEEQAKAKVFLSIMPLFARYSLDEIAAPLALEQQVMNSVMQRFESAAVKKDPDKTSDYWTRLNGRSIQVAPRDARRTQRNELNFH